MAIANKSDLIEYCKRRLGAPVINLELDDDQVDDRVSDAIRFYQDIHYDGTERVFMKHQVEGSKVVVPSTVGFMVGETVTGNMGARFELKKIEGNTLITRVFDTPPSIGETLTGNSSGSVTTVTTATIGDIERQYINIPDEIIGIIRVLPFKNNISNSNYIEYAFDPKYQIVVSEIHNLASASVVYYSQLMSHMELLNHQLRPLDSLTFNRNTNRVYINHDWKRIEVGEFLIFECFRVVNPTTFPDMFNDRLFQDYSTALIKRQWGSNLKKFDGVQMLGGVTIDGQRIFDEGQREVETIEEKIRAGFELPPIGFLG